MPSKLGPHALRPTPDARRLVEAGCRIIKLVDDFGAVGSYLAANPNLIVIGRAVSHTNFLEQLQREGSPIAAARRFVQEQTLTYQLNPMIRLWEGHNEPSFGGPDEAGALERMGQYAAFEAERLRLMDGLGLRGVVGNFSTGYPHIAGNDLRMWQAFAPALQAAERYNGVLGLHEYAAPWLWWWTGDYQAANCGRPDKWGWPGGFDAGWLTLRYRQVWRFVLSKISPKVKIAITELGLDRAGGGCVGMTTGNWRDVAESWGRWDGSADPIDYWRGRERDAERYYAEQLIWYDRRLREDDHVLGATVFTFGSTATWTNYDVAGTRIPGYLIDYIKAEAGVDDPTSSGQDPEAPPLPPEEGDNAMLKNTTYTDTYIWDTMHAGELPPEERGNTIHVPVGWDFKYLYDPAARLRWTDRKPGSPTFGQVRTQPDKFFKPESVVLAPPAGNDIRGNSGYVNLLKVFKGWGPIGFLLWQKAGGLTVGKQYVFRLPLFPDLVSAYGPNGKEFADDLAAGVFSARVAEGAALDFTTPNETTWATWYDGEDAQFGRWFTLEKVFTASKSEMLVGVECYSTFGLANSCYIFGPATLDPVGGESPPPADNNGLPVLTGLIVDQVQVTYRRP